MSQPKRCEKTMKDPLPFQDWLCEINACVARAWARGRATIQKVCDDYADGYAAAYVAAYTADGYAAVYVAAYTAAATAAGCTKVHKKMCRRIRKRLALGKMPCQRNGTLLSHAKRSKQNEN